MKKLLALVLVLTLALPVFGLAENTADENAEGLVAGDILEKLPVARLKLKNGE